MANKEDKSIEEMVEVCNRVMTAVKSQGKNGTVVCPRCNRSVKYWYGGPRAMDAKCSTEGCMHVQA